MFRPLPRLLSRHSAGSRAQLMLRRLTPSASSPTRQFTNHCGLRDQTRREEDRVSADDLKGAVNVPSGGRSEIVSREAWLQLVDSFDIPPQSTVTHGEIGTVYGFLGKRRDKSSQLSFCSLEGDGINYQIVSNSAGEGMDKDTQHDRRKEHENLKAIPSYSPVAVTGKFHTVVGTEAQKQRAFDIELLSIRSLNQFPKDIIVSKNAVWSPKQRHLQMRFDRDLRDRLFLRAQLQSVMRDTLSRMRFVEVETPVLFKSTPEGAREFLVPTRKRGHAYALPQSPQQYKQLLMAGGVRKYFQFAKCFRDEDHRSDRQPEFTQLDLEMSFADDEAVMRSVELIVNDVFTYISSKCTVSVENCAYHITPGSEPIKPENAVNVESRQASEAFCVAQAGKDFFPRYSYQDVMSKYGSDKPDLRIAEPFASQITRIDHFLPANFVGMITKHDSPIVEAFRFRPNETAETSSQLIKKFMDNLPNTPLKLDPASTPGVFVIDSKRPVRGLSALGHEAGNELLEMHSESWSPLEDGDIVMIHARKNEAFKGGSTDAGKLRTALYHMLVEDGIIPKDYSFKFLWVNNFPLFTPDGDDPGQGGSAGFSATHHPFTLPATPEDLSLLSTDPLAVKAAHYDLVLNGVEVGGGSRRIHVAELQEYIMRDVLKMSDQGVAQFSHLIEALRAGCPPHAGFAFGFDRLLSILCDVPSVRDVIAFPKNNKGEDMLVGSPSRTTPEQEKIYGLQGKK
ncbi:tRNA synthetases class II-domain-containing protein [Microdochium bolleyi]|uniref:tRNA synthetases class II-domain-containing protein n=1 Tax=Microdochium bolleyi TaxID=196109 RepID=A0A136JG57_9PEZI|nr:tRNA synthetases class II-domain-containing protein [Microdochium bolleyi]